MSKPLSVVIRADATQFQADLSRANAMAKVFAMKVQKDVDVSLSHPTANVMYTGLGRRQAEAAAARAAVNANVVNNAFTHGGILGAGAGGRRANFAVAGSMFTSVARDSAASLASGAPITQVIAQQAPQVLQALTMMRLGMVALRVSMVGAAIGGVLYMANAWRRWYFEVDKMEAAQGRIARVMANIARWKDQQKIQNTLEAENTVAEFDRNEKLIKQKQDLADAQAELSKEEARAHSFQTQKLRTDEVEKSLQKELLSIELNRAREKLKELQAVTSSRDVLKAQAEFTKIEGELSDKEAARFDFFTKGSGNSKLTPKEFQAELDKMDKELTSLTNQSIQAEKDLEAAKKGNNQAAVVGAKAEVLRIQNELDKLETEKEEKVKSSGRRDGAPDVTDRQRMNLMAVSNSPLLDVNRAQLRELQLIRQQMRGNSIDAAFGSP